MEKSNVELNESGAPIVLASNGLLEKIAFIILLLLPFLLPVFFIPSALFPFQFGKMIFFTVSVLLVFALWIIARLKDGKFVFYGRKIIVFLKK
jgi:hypothetical protein